MAVNTGAFKREAQANANQRGGRQFYDYSKVTVSHRTQGIFQLTSVKSYEDREYGNPAYGFLKLRVNFVYVVPGWEAAIDGTAEEQEKFRLKGHGKPFSLDFNPVVSPAGQRKNPKTGKMEAAKPSNLYEFLRIALNDGDPLTEEQMGRDLVPHTGQPNATQKAALTTWMNAFNAALDSAEAFDAFNESYPYGLVRDYEGNINEEPIGSLAEAIVRYPAFRLAQMLNKLEKTKAQFYATPVQKLSKSGEKYVKLTGVTAIVPDDERLETYRPYPRPRDPREEADNPEVRCTITGEALRGWEGKDGWVTNEKWAEMQAELFGEGFLFEHNGQLYPPPYGPRFYAQARDSRKVEEAPF